MKIVATSKTVPFLVNGVWHSAYQEHKIVALYEDGSHAVVGKW